MGPLFRFVKMKTVNVNWALIASVLSALTGLVGSVLTPIYGTHLSTSVQAVLQALSGFLILIPTFHAGSVAAYNAKLKYASELRTPSTIPENFAQPPVA